MSELEAAPLDTWRAVLMVEEALLTKPPVKVAKLLTSKVDEAFKAPATWRPAPTLLEAWEIKPAGKMAKPLKVEAPATVSVPEV